MKKFSCILFFVGLLGSGMAQLKTVRLYAKMGNELILASGDTTTYWGYGIYHAHSPLERATLPGPLLIFDSGDSVHIPFHNLSSEDHTIHWHGLDVDQLNDGVPHTSFVIHYGDSVIYKYKTPHPGSYLYHCHVQTVLHLPMGLYGMVLVRNAPDPTKLYNGGPGFNKEFTYLFSDMFKKWNDNYLSPGPFHFYDPDQFLVNGLSDWQQFSDPAQVINANAGDSIAVHFGNIGYTTIRLQFPPELNARVYMSDGRPLPASFASDTLRVYPGERYEVIFKPVADFTGYITATYHNAILDQPMGLNYIGVNSYVVPASTGEITADQKNRLIYPNPANDQINVVGNAGTIGFITDINGKILLQKVLVQGKNNIDISSLPNGLYVFYSVDGTGKFVVNR